jgi:hypothetical protein
MARFLFNAEVHMENLEQVVTLTRAAMLIERYYPPDKARKTVSAILTFGRGTK